MEMRAKHHLTIHLRKGSQGISLGLVQEVSILGHAHHIVSSGASAGREKGFGNPIQRRRRCETFYEIQRHDFEKGSVKYDLFENGE